MGSGGLQGIMRHENTEGNNDKNPRFSRVKFFGVTWGVQPRNGAAALTMIKGFVAALSFMLPCLLIMLVAFDDDSHPLLKVVGGIAIFFLMLGALAALNWLSNKTEDGSVD